jgi:hypothetical protein
MPRKLSTGTVGRGVVGSLSIVSTTISSAVPNADVELSPGGTGALLIAAPLLSTNSDNAVSATSGSIQVAGGVSVNGNTYIGGSLTSQAGFSGVAIGTTSPTTANFTSLTVTGTSTFSEYTETLSTKTGATGTVIHNFNESRIWYHSSIASNFTANITNVPTTDNRLITVTFYLIQGSTGRFVTNLNIDGVAQSIRWSGYSIPRPGTNSIDVQTFTLVRSGSSWIVFSSFSSLGTSYPGSSSTNPAPSGYWLANNFKNALSLTSGTYWIKSPSMPNALQMYVDMTQEDGGYDFYPITGGTSINFYGETHSGMALGLDLVYPRSSQHWTAMNNYVKNVLGDSSNVFFQIPYVVYRTTSSTGGTRNGNYTGQIMRDPRFYGTGASDWRTGDGGRWWLRNTTFGEPNGDYTARAWLGLAAGGYSMASYAGGDIAVNDGNSSYVTGTSYLVSTNAKP